MRGEAQGPRGADVGFSYGQRVWRCPVSGGDCGPTETGRSKENVHYQSGRSCSCELGYIHACPSTSSSRRHRNCRGTLTVLAAVLVPMVTAGCVATAAPGDSASTEQVRQEHSADGVAWGGVQAIPWGKTTVPVPGGRANATTFQVRTSGDGYLNGEEYLGDWSIDRGSAWFRVDVDGVPGQSVLIASGDGRAPGVLVSDVLLTSENSVELTLIVGGPFGETAQAARIVPDWGIALQEKAPTSGGGSGSVRWIDGGSVGAGGSSGSSGGTGSFGSFGAGRSFGSLGGPLLASG